MRHPKGLLLGALLLATSCSSRIGAPEPGTQEGDDVLGLWRVLFWAAVAVGGVVVLLIGWCVIRYRARPGDDREPSRTEGHVPLEVAYTLVPLALVGFLFTYNLLVDREIREDRAAQVDVDVTGFQWQWRFEYRDQGVTLVGDLGDPPTLVLPAGRTVTLHLRTADVVHSFFVPGFLVKRDLVPGIVNEITLRPTRPATYHGHCAEFCGLEHARMNFDVEVVPAEEFDRWASRQAA
ncbi:MAG TPA: cytochrome c oxidase subunit II [Acidimicrobiales bacterium]|nr:cytochrome c oxidase subunit II [Acidimicrobiales bacterium]